MDIKIILALVAVAVCILLNFCFTLAETALMRVSASRLQHRVHDEVQAASGASAENSELAGTLAERSVRALLGEPTRVVAAIQTSLTVISLTSVATAITLLGPSFSRFLYRHGVQHDQRVAVILMVVIVALLTLVLGEIVPRAVATRHAEISAAIVAGPLKWVERFERPLVALILALSNMVVRPFGMTASFRTPLITEDELRTVLDASQQQGVIQPDETAMLHNVISFGDTVAHKVMTPRVHVRAIEVEQPLAKLVNLIVDHGHSRIPVYENTIDTVVGIIHAKDLLPTLTRGQRVRGLRQLMRAPFFVPEQMRTDELLESMRHSNMQLAIVQDEYGGTAGLITIEDLLEEIVGEIRDEYDVEHSMITRDHASGSALIDARMPIEDVNSALNLSFSTEDFDTIGGYVFGLFGHPPLAGEQIETTTRSTETGVSELGVRFTVTKADGRRLQQLKVETYPAPVADPSGLSGTFPEREGNVTSA